jgi:dihydroorotate dehydrogenase electron transfer subunit
MLRAESSCMPSDVTTAVLANTDLGHGNWLLEFGVPEMAAAMRPAQFFMIGIPGSATLLRRPYSVCGLPGTFDERPAGAVQVLYKVVGHGTALLGSLAPGAPLTVLGPLGNGFNPPDDARTRPLFVAGGIGSAPFPAFAAALRDGYPQPQMIYGARSSGDLALADWFAEHTRLEIATEDGSAGVRGRVTEPLTRLLDRQGGPPLKLYACGPDPMLRAVARLARERGVDCELALEAHMACGFGVCLGCVVPVRRAGDKVGYDRVCMEGPVMDAACMAW